MSAEKIAEVLAAHQPSFTSGSHCECGRRYADPMGMTGDRSVAAHQAAALEPVIWERERVAWAAGFKQGGPMHDVNYDDPDAHRRNPCDIKEEA